MLTMRDGLKLPYIILKDAKTQKSSIFKKKIQVFGDPNYVELLITYGMEVLISHVANSLHFGFLFGWNMVLYM